MVFQDKSEREAKQFYLRDEVLQKGYDPEQFAEYLELQRPNGSDIDNWNISELEMMVELFKRSLDMPEVQSKFKEFLTQDEDDEIYCRRMRCSKREPTLLGDEVHKIKIKNWELVDGGFFSSKYALFHVEVKKFKNLVKRKAIDFQWLRDTLIKEFPGCYIPPVSRTAEKLLDDAILLSQANTFKIFVRDVLNHPELRRSPALEKFLMIANYEDFTEQKRLIDATLGHKKDVKLVVTKKALESDSIPDFPLESFKTSSGIVDLRISKNIKKFFFAYQEYLNHSEDLIAKMSKVSKDVATTISVVRDGLQEMGDLCTSLHQLNQDFNQRSEFGKDIVQEKVFFSLQNAFVCWGDVFDSQQKQFNTHIVKFFDTWKQELETVKDLVRTRNTVCSEYYRSKLELKDKKTNLKIIDTNDLDFESLHNAKLERNEVIKDPKLRQKFILPEQTRVVRRLADYFALFNNYIFTEIEWANAWRNKKSMDNFMLFADQQGKLVTQTHLIWAEIGSHLKDYESRVDRNLEIAESRPIPVA